MIEYRDTVEGIGENMLKGFFEGWRRRVEPREHLELMRNSHAVTLAVDTGGETETVVGFITAVSDGVLCAYIPLFEVLPEYRGRGIGTELVRRMLARLRDFYMIDLLCDENLTEYYRCLGLVPARGMCIRNLPD